MKSIRSYALASLVLANMACSTDKKSKPMVHPENMPKNMVPPEDDTKKTPQDGAGTEKDGKPTSDNSTARNENPPPGSKDTNPVSADKPNPNIPGQKTETVFEQFFINEPIATTIKDKILYVVAKNELAIIDLTGNSPKLISRIKDVSLATKQPFDIYGRLFFIEDALYFTSWNGMHIFDVRNLHAPKIKLTDSKLAVGAPWVVHNSTLYLSRNDGLLHRYNVSDPFLPIFKGISQVDVPLNMELRGNLLFASSYKGITVYSLSDKSPQKLSLIPYKAVPLTFLFTVQGNTVHFINDGKKIAYDITDPKNPALLSGANPPSAPGPLVKWTRIDENQLLSCDNGTVSLHDFRVGPWEVTKKWNNFILPICTASIETSEGFVTFSLNDGGILISPWSTNFNQKSYIYSASKNATVSPESQTEPGTFAVSLGNVVAKLKIQNGSNSSFTEYYNYFKDGLMNSKDQMKSGAWGNYIQSYFTTLESPTATAPTQIYFKDPAELDSAQIVNSPALSCQSGVSDDRFFHINLAGDNATVSRWATPTGPFVDTKSLGALKIQCVIDGFSNSGKSLLYSHLSNSFALNSFAENYNLVPEKTWTLAQPLNQTSIIRSLLDNKLVAVADESATGRSVQFYSLLNQESTKTELKPFAEIPLPTGVTVKAIGDMRDALLPVFLNSAPWEIIIKVNATDLKATIWDYKNVTGFEGTLTSIPLGGGRFVNLAADWLRVVKITP